MRLVLAPTSESGSKQRASKRRGEGYPKAELVSLRTPEVLGTPRPVLELIDVQSRMNDA